MIATTSRRTGPYIAVLALAASCVSRSHPPRPAPPPFANSPASPVDFQVVLAALERSLPALPIARAPRATSTTESTEPLPDDPVLGLELARGDRITHARGTIRVGMPVTDAIAIEPYLDDLLDRATTALGARYAVDPPDVHVEMYASRQAMRARVARLGRYDVDGAHAAGTIVMIAPSGGGGNWGQTLVHELAHAFQHARYVDRLPRWLAEGMAEADAHAIREEWVREPGAELGRILPRDGESLIPSLTRSIESPVTDREQGDAYWLAMTFVEDARARGLERCPPEAAPLDRTTGGETGPCPSVEELGVAFVAARGAELEARAGRHVPPIVARDVAAGASDADALAQRAANALVEHRFEDAARAADASLALAPELRLALYVRARAAIAKGDVDAVRFLERLVALGGALEARLALARVALAADDAARAAVHVRAALALGEPSAEAWDLALRLAGRVPEFDARECRRRIADLDERAGDLGLEEVRAARREHRWDLVTRYGERLVYSTPNRFELHDALAAAYEHGGESSLLARERQLAERLAPTAARSQTQETR